jgi:hypothetical protein
MNTLKPNIILESITKIHENREKLLRQTDLLNELKNDVDGVSQFLELDSKMSILLSVLICEQLMGEIVSVKKMMKHMGFASIDIIKSNESIKMLKKRGWLSVSKRRMHSFKLDEYEVSKHLLDAITYNDKNKLDKKEPENLAMALLHMRQFITNALGDYELDELTDSICIEMERHTNFNFIRVIYESKLLIDLEKVILIWMASEVMRGREEFDFNNIIEIFTQDPSYTFWFKSRISSGKSQLVTDGYIEFKRPNFIDFTAVAIGIKINDLLDELRQDTDHKKKSVRYTTLIEPKDLNEQKLFFNKNDENNFQKVDQLLDDEKYKALMNQFQYKGMKQCLTMLFHGLPGTGKTELVKQMALKHRRNIYQVDLSGIKDMWVGESEKNLKRVFKEYNDSLKYSSKTPILLFNEADALLGIRVNVRHSTDQMHNSLQNILLQELEDMNGIFIATTNLINNIDGAFDRRLLFKQKFELPNTETRTKILELQFPEMNKELLNKLSQDYDLSGGQIQNIKRKLMADQILFGNSFITDQLLLEYIENEIRFRTNKNKIGY